MTRQPEDNDRGDGAAEVRFADGNLTAVVRVGDTVRRATGFWTPAVHALLRHLADAGFTGAPRVLGIDNRGREILSHIAGQTGSDSLAGLRADDVLIAVAKLIRRYHDVTVGFQPPPGAVWQTEPGAPRTGEIICHNDLAPYNTVFVGQRPIAFIDWDFAAPGPRLWDIAHALWRFVPLYAADRGDSLADRAKRLHLFCDAYGLADRAGVVETIARRQRVLYDTLLSRANAGDPAFVFLRQAGHGELIQRDMVYLARYHPEFERALTD